MSREPHPSDAARRWTRRLLGAVLIFAGATHLTVAREEFRAQVPTWVPAKPDDVVIASGVVEIGLGGALLLLTRERRRVGWIAAAFFTAIFPGNIAQYTERRSAFGLDTDRKRALRLLGQPLLVAAALWSTRDTDFGTGRHRSEETS